MTDSETQSPAYSCFSRRHRIFGENVRRRNNRRLPSGQHTNWPVVFTDMIVIAFIFGLVSYFLFDEWALRNAIGSSPVVVTFFGAITDMGKAEIPLVITGVLCLLLVFYDWQALSPRRQVWLSNLLFDAWFLFLAVAGSGILANVLKLVFGRARPKHLDSLGFGYFDPFRFEASFASFPSGHSTTIAAISTVFALRFPKLTPVFAMIALTIGISRVFVGAHYPSDVLAGLMLGMVCTLFLARVFAQRNTGFRFVQSGSHESSIPRRRVIRGIRRKISSS